MQAIPGIPSESCWTKPTREAAAALSAAIKVHNEKVAEHVARCEELNQQNVEAVDPDRLFDSEVAKAGFTLRREELAIRKDLVDFYTKRQADRAAAVEKLLGKPEKARATLVAKLNELGFTGDGEQFRNDVPGSIMPGMLLNHPSVRDASEALHNARALVQSFADRSQNIDRIAEVEAELVKIRRRAAAA